MTKSNSHDAFAAHRKVLEIPGIWPVEDPSLTYRLRAVIAWTLLSGLVILMAIEVFNDLDKFTKLSETLYVLLTVVAGMMKVGSLIYHKKSFIEMIIFLKDPVFVSYPDEMDHYMAKTIKISQFIAKFYWFLCVGCILMYAVFPVVDNTPLPFPFPYEVGMFRYPMYIFEVLAIGTSAWTNSTMDTIIASLMGLGAAQLDILVEKIEKVPENEEGEPCEDERERKINKRFQQCVEHHLAIIKFIESIEEIFSIGLFGQFASSIVVICNTLFQFILIKVASAQFLLLVSYFLIMVMQLTMYCGYGNEIMLKSVRVGDACYMSKWYKCGKSTNKYLFIIMERSKKPLAITVMKFSKLSLTALTSILQWSYSYLALLLKMYNKQSTDA